MEAAAISWLALGKVTSDRRIRAVVTHEVGHALAYEHEQSRPDAAGYCPDGDSYLAGTVLTSEYDDLGIMNYCQPSGFGRTSLTDLRGAQIRYGTSAAGQWLKAQPVLSYPTMF